MEESELHFELMDVPRSLSLKPIFHWIPGSRWPPNANEIDILRWGPNTTSYWLAWGFALGVTQISCIALGVMQTLVFLDNNMLVYPMQNFVLGV